ncbi:MAG: hypothetical protein JNL82_00835 [Myxococcales bacterium]|nr:hypothetical protein [Myxococcales bacterium]
MHLLRMVPAMVSLLIVTPGCKGDASGESDDSSGSSSDASGGDTAEPTGEAAGPTYWQDVAPVYFKNCVACHQGGGIAPFGLDTAEEAATWAAASADAVARRTMPPWLVTDDGSCNEFRGSRALADEDIATIAAWAAAGAQAGEERDDLVVPAPPHLEDGVDVLTPEFAPEPAGGPLAEFDEYRCFLLDPGIDEDLWIAGYEVSPGNAPLVHHVLGMPVDPSLVTESGLTNAEVMQALDDESPERPGWPCFSAAGEGVEIDGLPVTWAPGMGAVRYPEGTGVRMGKDHAFVVQVHYNLHEPELAGQTDATRVRLDLVESVARPAFVDMVDLFINTLFTGEPGQIPAGEAAALVTWDADVGAWYVEGTGAEAVEVHGVFPHMHERGRRWRAELIDGDEARCLGEVRAWDFDWQLFYFYDEPLVLRPGTRLRVTCEYDTRDVAEPVTPGWGTQNEMCLAGLFVVP